MLDEVLEPRGKDVAGDPQAALEVREAGDAPEERMPDDHQAPALAGDFKRTRRGAVLRVVGTAAGMPETPQISEVYGLHADAYGISRDAFGARMTERTLRKQLPTVAEIANVATFIASDRSNAITGAIVNLHRRHDLRLAHQGRRCSSAKVHTTLCLAFSAIV